MIVSRQEIGDAVSLSTSIIHHDRKVLQFIWLVILVLVSLFQDSCGDIDRDIESIEWIDDFASSFTSRWNG